MKEGKTAKPSHQAFLLLAESVTGLDTSFALAIKENGKGKVEIVRAPTLLGLNGILIPYIKTHKDLPSQLLTSPKPLSASIVIGSFGSSKPFNRVAFELSIKHDPNSLPPPHERLLRYGKLSEIHHLFRPDPTSPPKFITLFFGAAVIAALPLLLVAVNAAFFGPDCD